MIRDCSSFTGLDGEFVRFCIMDPEDNRRLLTVFQKISQSARKQVWFIYRELPPWKKATFHVNQTWNVAFSCISIHSFQYFSKYWFASVSESLNFSFNRNKTCSFVSPISCRNSSSVSALINCIQLSSSVSGYWCFASFGNSNTCNYTSFFQQKQWTKSKNLSQSLHFLFINIICFLSMENILSHSTAAFSRRLILVLLFFCIVHTNDTSVLHRGYHSLYRT